jgi:sugar/nucleoside kinase (ribokinase family)
MEQLPLQYDVVTIGNYTRDTVVNPAGERQVDGGGVAYAAFAAAGLGCRVAAITRLAQEDFRAVRKLESAGVDVYPTITESSTLMRLEYPTGNPDERILTVAATAGSLTPEQLLAVAARSYLVSASIRGEVPVEVVRKLRATGATVSLDVQGYVRIRRDDGRLEHAEWSEAAEVLGMVDIVKADVVEARSLTGLEDIAEAARGLAAYGPTEVLVTHRDGVLLLADGELYRAPFHPARMVGRSGRGDTCLGSYVATRLRLPPDQAVVWAAAATSLKMEADGPFNRPISDVIDLIESSYAPGKWFPRAVAAMAREHEGR